MDAITDVRHDADYTRTVLEAIPAMVGYWDAELRNRMANRAYVDFFGLTPDDMHGRHMREVLGPELFARNLPYIEGALRGEPQLFDRTIVDTTGRTRHTQASYIPDVRDGIVLGFTALVTDITERKRAEDELSRSRRQLAEAERVAQIGSWEWDIARDQVSWSEGLFRIYGLTPEEFDPTIGGGERRVYPDDRGLVREALRTAVAERSSFAIEYRAVRSDGRVRTLRSRAEVSVDESGEAVRLVGITQDVTESRLAQEALRSTSAELERRAVELQRIALRADEEATPEGHAALTRRQVEIVRLIAQGLTSRQIAERLFVTEATVKWHVRQVLAKTGASNRAEAVARVLGTPPG